MKPKPQIRALGTTGQPLLTSSGLSGQRPDPGRPPPPAPIFQARPHVAFPTFLLAAQTPSARPSEADSWGWCEPSKRHKEGGARGGGNVSATQKGSRGEERGPRFTSQSSAPLSAATLASPSGPPNALPLPMGTPSIRPLFRSFRSHRPCDPCPAPPHGSCQLLGAALPFSPGQLGCPRVPDLPRIASPCAPDAPSRGPLAPSSPGPEDLYSLQSPSRTLRRSGCPSHACPGVPRSSPESARSSPARPPRFPRPPRAGSAPWAGGWAPASWSWPSGPCRRAEPSQGPSAAPGSPQRRPPRPTRWDPALTGQLPPPIGWGRCYSPEAPPHPEASPPAPAPSGAPQRAPPSWALGTARRAVTGPDACQSPGPTASGGGGTKGGAGAALTCPRPPLPRRPARRPPRPFPASRALLRGGRC